METSISSNVPVVSFKSHGGALIPGRAAAIETTVPLPRRQASTAEIDYSVNNADARREQAIRQAANTFVLSDQRFTIYKDLSGQFVTRFTSLRDGRVTYIPEPDVLSWLNQGGGNSALSLEV